MATMTEEKVLETGSLLKDTTSELPKHAKGSEKSLAGNEGKVGPEAFAASAFTTYWTWRGNGVVQALRFIHPAINANSRVVVSISEYGTSPNTTSFIGGARMNVYNVAPFNGGFFAWVEVSWGSPLNVRFDVFVEP